MKKDNNWWNWPVVNVPYSSNWNAALEAERYLGLISPNKEFEVRVSKDWPINRPKKFKVIVMHHYYIKDPRNASIFALKYAGKEFND